MFLQNDYYTSHIIRSLHCFEIVLQVSMRHKLQDEHHWVGGGDTAKHLQDVRVVAIRYFLHHINLIQKQLFFFNIAVICNCSTSGTSAQVCVQQ